MQSLTIWKRCVIFVLSMVVGLLAVSSVLSAGPTGATPNDPLMVPTGPQTIAPGASLWFYFDYAVDYTTLNSPRAPRTTGRSFVNVTVDADGKGKLQLAIYTPTQATDWLRDATTAPVGRGTPYFDTTYDVVTHDLYWSGAFNSSGRYFAVITNTSTENITFRMTLTGDGVTLYPVPTPVPSPTLYVPFTVTPVPTGTIQGKVVFETATGGAIFTVNGDGSNLQLVSNGVDPSWSPDGKKITFGRWNNVNPGLYIANADGTNEQILFGAPRLRSPRWSPDGKYIVFTQDKSKNENTPIWKLGLIEVATGKLTEPACSRLCLVPSWSNDSSTIAYTDPNLGIMKTSILGGSESVLMGPSGYYWDTGANILRPILQMPLIQTSEVSPDGGRVVYSQIAHDRWEVNVVLADGNNPTPVTSPDPIMYYLLGIEFHNVAPTWSADGKEILFLSNRNGKWEFFAADPSGAKLRQVLKNVTDLVPLRFDHENERMMDWTK